MVDPEKPREKELDSIEPEKTTYVVHRADPDALRKAAESDRMEERIARQDDQREIDKLRANLGLKPVDIEGFDTGVQTMMKQIDVLLVKKDQVLISVAGKTGSGKTVFANKLRDDLSERDVTSTVINTDDFYKNGESDLDLEKLHDTISKLQQDLNVGRLQPVKVIIVEGLQTVTDSTLGQKADSRAYIEVPFKERIARRLLRDEEVGFRSVKESLNILAQLSVVILHKL